MPRIASGWSAAIQSAANRAEMSASRWDRHTRIVRHLRLMADYECYPLWESQEEGMHNVDPFELAIPEQLAEALTEWAGQSDEAPRTRMRDRVGAAKSHRVAGAWTPARTG